MCNVTAIKGDQCLLLTIYSFIEMVHKILWLGGILQTMDSSNLLIYMC